MSTETINGSQVFHYRKDGQLLTSEQHALDLIGAVYGEEVDVIAIPAQRLGNDFYRLKSGLAGAFIQKLQTYGYRLAVVGDIAAWIEQSRRRAISFTSPMGAALPCSRPTATP